MMLTLFRFFMLVVLVLPLGSNASEIKGVGRKASAKVLDAWAKQFSAQYPETTVAFEVVSPTESVKRVETANADFGETDAPLDKGILEKEGLTQFPYMFTAITPVVNLPNVFNNQLRLDGKVLAEIFLGNITRWNDPAIVADNPRISLPNEKIIVVHGAEGADGTYAMNTYLSKAHAEWKPKTGVGNAVKWPVGTAMPDLLAIGDYVKQTPYTIGYSEISYVRKKDIVYVQLQNSQGRFVSPHTGSVENSVKNVKWKSTNGFMEDITDEKGEGSWPIPSASYIVIKKTSADVKHRLELLKFLGWGLTLGDMIVTDMDLMPLQRSIFAQIRTIWNDTPLAIEGAEVVDAKQVLELRSKGVMIVDARVAPEYEEAHIPLAISIPYGEKSEKSSNFNPAVDKFDLSKLPGNKNAGIVFYCNAGACWKGYKAAVVSVNAGYKKVYWFRGGLPEWMNRNFPVESSVPSVAKK